MRELRRDQRREGDGIGAHVGQRVGEKGSQARAWRVGLGHVPNSLQAHKAADAQGTASVGSSECPASSAEKDWRAGKAEAGPAGRPRQPPGERLGPAALGTCERGGALEHIPSPLPQQPLASVACSYALRGEGRPLPAASFSRRAALLGRCWPLPKLDLGNSDANPVGGRRVPRGFHRAPWLRAKRSQATGWPGSR